MIINVTPIDDDYFIPISVSGELIDKCGFTDAVSVEVIGDAIIISKAQKMRCKNKT